jgi:hypothetical protein
VQLGPFLQTWPAGLVLELALQGDVVQRARVVHPPHGPTKDIFEGVSSRLRSAARLLRLLELGSLAERCRWAAAAHDRRQAVDIVALRTAIRRSGAFAALPAGLGACRLDGAPGDIRSRLLAWLGDGADLSKEAATDLKPKLSRLLTGLEWHEAWLVINSFTPQQLHGMALCEKAPAEGDDDPSSGTHPAMEHAH